MADKKFDFLNKIGLGNAWTNIKNYINSFTYSKTELNTKLDEKASDSDVVHKSGNETIGGVKTFSNTQTFFGRDVCCYSNAKYGKKINPTTTSYQYVFFYGNTVSNGTTNNWYGGYLEQVVMSNGASRGRWLVRNTDEQAVSVELLASMDGAKTLRPTNNNVITLGLTSHKWADVNTSLINGINPGALSLPSNSYTNVDTTDWDLTCQNALLGSFTPNADGWLMLHVANSGTGEVSFWVIGGALRINNKSTLNTSNNDNFNMITIPVEKGKTYNIYGNASEYVVGRRIGYCRFMPCQGNV